MSLEAQMIRVFSDFNAMTPDEVCWNLVYQGTDLEKQLDKLQLSKGDKIILYQDEGDFDVIATLDYRFVAMLGRMALVAVPDWSTMNQR